jgi:hypothetical protein
MTPDEFNITDHGAFGDGQTLNTAAIQAKEVVRLPDLKGRVTVDVQY